MAKNSNGSGLGQYAVRSKDGSISVEASVAKFAAELEAYKSLQESGAEQIMTAHDQVMTEVGATNINFGYLTSSVVAKLNPSPATFNETKERVDAQLRTVYLVRKGRSKDGLTRRDAQTDSK